MLLQQSSRIYVAGHNGLVGSAVLRRLLQLGHTNLVTRSRAELDLTDQAVVRQFMSRERPDAMIMAAARVGGILANNTHPALFMRDNLQIQDNLIDAAHRFGVGKVVFLGSSCIYPKHAAQPMKEEYLLTGPLEPTNEWYAVAKIAGLKMCQAYRREFGMNAISLMPTNLYGPGDNFDLENSHVLPALIRRFHEAKIAERENVTIWGTGSPRREFLHVDDLADAVVHLMYSYDSEDTLNIGCGEDISISELAQLVKSVVGFAGQVVFDSSKPDGTPRKLLDITRLSSLGWRAKVPLQNGIEQTYEWFRKHLSEARL